MGFRNILARLTGEAQLGELAEAIASQCMDSVWKRVQTRGVTLNANELRGYVRARGTPIIGEHLERVVANAGGIKESHRSRLEQLTFEAVLQLVATKARLAFARASTQQRRAA